MNMMKRIAANLTGSAYRAEIVKSIEIETRNAELIRDITALVIARNERNAR